MKPVIGIVANQEILTKGAFLGNKRAFLANTYVEAVEKAGGVPIIIPQNNVGENIKEQVKRMDGIILSGGVDVDPRLYNEDPEFKLGFVNPSQDKFNINVIHSAIELNKPILGICRGLQILNVAFGGSLYQDLSYIENCNVKHIQECQSSEGTHLIKVNSDSKLSRIIGEKIYVNSYHHQSIKSLGKGLRAVAYSTDNLVEAIEREGEEFVIGVQFHPEAMINSSEEMLNIFKALIKECENYSIKNT